MLRTRARANGWSWFLGLSVCWALALPACSKKSGGASEHTTFDATFSGAAATNASTSELQLVFETRGSNGAVTASAAYLVVNGTGSLTIIWSDGGSPKRTITIDTSGTPAAGSTYNTDATQGQSGDNTFTYKEGGELWDGTGTINIASVDQSSGLIDFTAHMAMQPDAASAGGAMGTFTVDVTSTTSVFGL